TLGRGGSDTSAVAISAALHADLCQIYTDVDGVYTADPRLVKNAIKLDEISFDEMLELATLGAQVLHNRSVEMAKRYNVNLEVLSSLENVSGTKVKEKIKMEKLLIRGVTRDDDIARIALLNIPDEPGFAYRIFSLMGKHNINVDIILQSIGRHDTKDISFTVPIDQMDLAKNVLEKEKNSIGMGEIQVSDAVSKVSIVGAGMQSNPGVAAKLFEALFDAEINIHMISTSEIKISVLIDKKDSARAVDVIHEKFFD
ncbi:MAG: aspartate kinase, partial [Oscillospiraceae bacterium]|nr:aspartate kinase [Oscillospiraceae bacterium]